MKPNNKPVPNLGYILAQSAHKWRTAVAEVLLPHGLTPLQFFLLMAVYRRQHIHHQVLTQKNAAVHSAMDLNVVSQRSRSLVERGLIDRQVHSKDGRAYVLSLTAEGQALAAASSADVRVCNNVFLPTVMSKY